uniref:WASH complex subunit strumpellin n=1 Tax=Angiostrongylus cantonensis TaxID=6313 RepID=A0A158P8E8_ANGCA
MSSLTSMGAMANEAFMLRVKEEANCILAEIVRLASFIPQDFTDPKSSKFKLLLLDFSYFTNAAHYEKLIAENEDLQDQFYNTNGDLLSRFSTLFQTIAMFLCSLKEYSDQVSNDRIGVSYLDIVDIEILFHIGLVLLYSEKFLPGIFSDEQRNMDFLVEFLRVNPPTGTNCLFERLKVNESFVDTCLSCCEAIHKEGASDFGKLHVDRNTLIKWIFICLLFKQSVLKTDHIRMRKIVEDFFRDDWVLQLGLGLNVNVLDAWQQYRAAFAAITSQMDIKIAKEMASLHYSTLGRLTIPQAYNECLRNKEESIKKLTSSTCSLINEMVQFLSQDFGSLNKDKKTAAVRIVSAKLRDWFLLMKKTLEDLDPNSKQNSGLVMQIKKRIIQVGEMLELSGRIALAQHLRLLESHLDSLSALYSVREEEERRLRRSADPSYLWPVLDDWTPKIQRRILESSNAHALRALFFKLSLSISVLCEQFENDERKNLGISRMALRKVGIVNVNPKELLEEGIRRELASELPLLLTVSEMPSSLEDLLKKLSDTLHSFHRAFIYMCGHVDINGNDMWRAEQAGSSSTNSTQALFVITNLLLKHSNPTYNRYMEDSMKWREMKTKKDVLSSKIIDSIERWIPSTAINSLRVILSLDIETCINDALKLLNTLLTTVGSFTFDEVFIQSTQYDQLLRLIQGNSLLPQFIVKAGQLLLLLSMLCYSRKQHCQLHAAPLFSALSACDRFLLASPDSVPADVVPLLNLLRDCGLCSPSLTVYKSYVTVPPNAVILAMMDSVAIVL